MSKFSKNIEKSLLKNESRLLLSFKRSFSYERYTYLDIHNYALKTITHLNSKGIKPGDKIAICANNCPQYMYLMLASILYGTIIVPLEFMSSDKLMKDILSKTNPKILFTSRYKQTNLKIKREYVEDLNYELKDLPLTIPSSSPKDDDLFEIIYTSGTTGKPKGVMITHENINSNIIAASKVIEFREDYSHVSTLPLSHAFEQVGGCLVPIYAGARTVHIEQMRPSEISKVLNKEKPNILISVPAFFNLLKSKVDDRAKFEGQDKKLKFMLNLADKIPFEMRKIVFSKIHSAFGGNLRVIVTGAASLPEETEMFWQRIGVKVIKGYGLTESSPILTLSNLNEIVIGSVGKPIPGVRIKLSDDNEILARGPNTVRGYYKNKTATQELYVNGWMRTGDIGEFDNEGNLFIKGRVKNMILKSSGLNIYPEDIEKVFDDIPEVKESCVLGLKVSGEINTHAVIIPKRGVNENQLEKIRKNANSILETHQVIQSISVWHEPEFPKTHTRKIKRNLVKQGLGKINNMAIDSSDQLISIISKISLKKPVDISNKKTLFSDLGLDSLKIIELCNMVEINLGIELDESLITHHTTVKELRDMIQEPKPKTYGISRSMFSPLLYPIKAILPEFAYLMLMPFITKVKITGRNNLKRVKHPVIFILNHESHLDAPVIMKHLPIRFRTKLGYAVASDYFHRDDSLKSKIISKLFLTFGGFPMVRKQFSKTNFSLKHSLEYVGEIIDHEWSIAIAPEGTRTRHGKINPFKPGIGIIVKETGLPVIPIKVKGLYKMLKPGTKKINRGPIEVKFGIPINVDTRLDYLEITKILEGKMREM